ncbi:MAG: deoxyribodipyrimidine photo-lyase [Flavobacteriaceae bacterium]|nr:deoxyribodipyrimidine photo-lyase [Flavobacteriaceae bacterium]
MKTKVSFFWFRRDLRLKDNRGLSNALQFGNKIIPLFIFDEEILNSLPKNDARITFIYQTLEQLNNELKKFNTTLLIVKGNPIQVWCDLSNKYDIDSVYTNKDYEPYAIKRDAKVKEILAAKNIQFYSFKDQVIFEEFDIVKADGKPYTVYTPYKNKWKQTFDKAIDVKEYQTHHVNFYQQNFNFPNLSSLGFVASSIQVKPYNLDFIDTYKELRDYPFKDKTSYLSPYLRFGVVSVRKMVTFALQTNEAFLEELIWREFFMQILFHFPKVVTNNFKQQYDGVQWRNHKEEFDKWCKGETGYPLVDAGMRQLNETGYMHNRVRMVTAGFLCKHLLIDWRWGEAFFAQKLLDYDLAANNGNWQWAAGTGCDAAPYFRIFNPTEQLKKFDKELKYTNQWVKDYNELTYPNPIVEHKYARERALKAYKKALC